MDLVCAVRKRRLLAHPVAEKILCRLRAGFGSLRQPDLIQAALSQGNDQGIRGGGQLGERIAFRRIERADPAFQGIPCRFRAYCTYGRRACGENRQQVVSDMSRMLKIMAKELDVPVICLSQLSRANEKRDDKRPMLSDLRESGAIEQDADIVLFLYRDDYYNEDSEKHNIAECIVAKNRHGETGKVELRWMPEYTQFSTLDKRYDDED